MDLREAQLSNYIPLRRHPWELARIEVVRELIKKNLPLIEKENSTILDVGCGDTFLIEELSNSFPKASFIAVDNAFNQEMIQSLNRRFENEKKAIHVFNNLKSTRDVVKQIDSVLLLDVIEHVPDDVALLKEIQDIKGVNEMTVFFITVPAFQKLFCQHDNFLGHYRRYTNESLESSIKKAGLNKINVGYFFFSLLLPRVVQVVVEKLFKPAKATGIGEWKGGKFKTNIIKDILGLDFKISKNLKKAGFKLPGLSNYIICKKAVL